MTVTADQAAWFSQTFSAMVANCDKAVLGKEHVIRLSLTCMLSEGHLLLEDFPGTGKTQLARAISGTVQGTNSRIQFTPDLLPSDVTGVTIYDPGTKVFEFHRGPIFATIVLADEINRASPKTQSALLEVMEEGKVTVDGVRHEVGAPFMVIATQNPIEQAGTYRLPEAQLDRFLMKTSLGYPDHDATVRVLRDAKTRDRTKALEPVVTSSVVTDMAELADEVHVDDAILDYVSRIAEETRRHISVRLGPLGPRLPGLRALREDLGHQPGPRPRHARRHQAARAPRPQPPPPRHRGGRVRRHHRRPGHHADPRRGLAAHGAPRVMSTDDGSTSRRSDAHRGRGLR